MAFEHWTNTRAQANDTIYLAALDHSHCLAPETWNLVAQYARDPRFALRGQDVKRYAQILRSATAVVVRYLELAMEAEKDPLFLGPATLGMVRNAPYLCLKNSMVYADVRLGKSILCKIEQRDIYEAIYTFFSTITPTLPDTHPHKYFDWLIKPERLADGRVRVVPMPLRSGNPFTLPGS